MPPMPPEAVLMGDFNFEPDAAECDRMVGPRSERYGRLNNRDGFVDSWVAAGYDEGEGVSCETTRIDYIFVSASLHGCVTSAWIDREAQGSDHRPIGIELDA